ncbi:efflux RND transporter permease subunit [Catenovulum sp. 2E275]|uniref:efflux RND transporter permease subunit n=1 Tax=Catenovulum sp. 2E275 TaxID=2980497 RepID=UPI0021CE57C5|nr:efflux RND transporter permease subunit [Catenovulum sp. 2E275]MCU4676803.1 efflux RND transporter permease subunit [Catenovulum sp. 2E275]
MNIAATSLHYRKPLFFILALGILYGVFSYFTLPAREDPEITIREAIVSTQYPGMSAERVERLITKKLEEAIRKIPEVERIRSTSSIGSSVIHVEIADRYFNLDNIWQDLRNKVTSAQSQLPQGTQSSQINDEFGDVAIITLALTADGFSLAQMYDTAKHIRDTLYGVAGTKKIDLLGVQQEQIYLEIANNKLAQLGIDPAQLGAILQSQNIISPGGSIDTGLKSYVLEPSGNFNSIEEIGNLLISLPNLNQPILLRDLAQIKRGYIDPPEKLAYYNGKPALVFAISMLSGFNVLDYSPVLKAKLAEIEQTLPLGYQLEIATYQADQVEQTVYGVSVNVLQTLIIVLVVVMIFLGVRVGLIVGSIVPCVMLISLAIMNFSGINLERMSLATLIIALGLLIDNGIVIAEDFKARLEQGEDRMYALTHGPSSLAIPLLSSSVSTILFFLPLMLAQHVAGEYTRSISLVILISLMASWLLALSITPVLCYFFVDKPKQNQPNTKNNQAAKSSKTFIFIQQKYHSILDWTLGHKLLSLCIAFALLVLSIGSMPFLNKQFFPDSDRLQILVDIELEPDASSRATDAAMQEIFNWLKQDEFSQISSYAAYVGFGGPRFVLSLSPQDPASNKGFMVLNLDDASQMEPTITQLRNGFRTQFPYLSARVNKMFLGPSDSSVISIQVKGPDQEVIYQTAENIQSILASIDGTIDIRNNWEGRITKVKVLVDQHRARRAGITSDDVAQTLQAYFSGAQISQYREDDNIIPILYRAKLDERYNLDRLRTVNIYSPNTQHYIPLFQIAEFEPFNEFAKIQKEDLFKTVTVEARHLTLTAEILKQKIDQQIQTLKQSLPLNHTIEYDGVVKESAEAQKALAQYMPLVLALIVILLVVQFNSFRRPLIIIATIPLAFIGAVAGLWIMQAPFGFMVSLGLYSLAGIIINNAIVLIDKIDLNRQAGQNINEAIFEACNSRLRPICMTTITTVLGLLPLILSHDPLFYGLACVLAYGLALGTLLTLCIVPCLYALFYRQDEINQA